MALGLAPRNQKRAEKQDTEKAKCTDTEPSPPPVR